MNFKFLVPLLTAFTVLCAAPVQASLITSADPSLLLRYDTDVNGREGFTPTQGNLIGTINAFDLTTSTVSFWMRLDSIQSGWNSILHVGNGNYERQPAFWMYPSDDRLHYRMGSSTGWNTGVDPVVPVTIGEWLKVSTVWDGATGSVYFNSDLVATVSLDLSWSASDSGSWNVYAGDPWYTPMDGKLDDIRIYNRALTISELNANDIVTSQVDEPYTALLFAGGMFFLATRKLRNRR